MSGFESPSRAAATAAAGEYTRRDSTLIEQPWSFPVTSIELFRAKAIQQSWKGYTGG